MTFAELVATSRTCRYFRNTPHLTEGILSDLVNMAHLAPSARNLQPLRYALVVSPEARKEFFPLLNMMGGRSAEERADETRHPAGYIVLIAPKGLNDFGVMDIGIAAQTINLAARSAGLACCMIGAFNKPAADAFLGVPEDMESRLVLALGAPDEDCRLTGPGADGSLTYYNDEAKVHWVPKLPLTDVITLVK